MAFKAYLTHVTFPGDVAKLARRRGSLVGVIGEGRPRVASPRVSSPRVLSSGGNVEDAKDISQSIRRIPRRAELPTRVPDPPRPTRPLTSGWHEYPVDRFLVGPKVTRKKTGRSLGFLVDLPVHRGDLCHYGKGPCRSHKGNRRVCDFARRGGCRWDVPREVMVGGKTVLFDPHSPMSADPQEAVALYIRTTCKFCHICAGHAKC